MRPLVRSPSKLLRWPSDRSRGRTSASPTRSPELDVLGRPLDARPRPLGRSCSSLLDGGGVEGRFLSILFLVVDVLVVDDIDDSVVAARDIGSMDLDGGEDFLVVGDGEGFLVGEDFLGVDGELESLELEEPEVAAGLGPLSRKGQSLALLRLV